MIGEMRELGAVWLRLNVMWANIEKTEGQYDWSYFDTVVRRAREAGIELLINVRGYTGAGWPGYVRELYVADRAEKLAAYERFLRELVRRYKGQIRYWQIENEVEWQDWWRGTMDEYVLVLGAAYRTIKNEDTTSQVLIAGCPTAPFFLADLSNPLNPVSDLAWVRNYFERLRFILDRGRQYFDILDVHLYGKPERMTERIDFFRQQMRSFGYQKPIWLTETGGPDMREGVADSGKWEQLPPGDTDTQAREVPKRYALALAAGVDRIFWHSLTQQDVPTQNVWSGMALVRGKQRRPAFSAYQLMVQKLEGFTAVERLDLAVGVWAFRFAKPPSEVYVVWADSARVVSLPATSKSIIVTDIFGKTLQASPSQLSVTETPVFVEAAR